MVSKVRTHPLVNGNSSFMDKKFDKLLFSFTENELVLSNRHKDEDLSSYSNPWRGSECPETNYTEEKAKCLKRFSDVANIDETTGVDMGESCIISDKLSLDFDPWDDSLSSSANNFAKLLCETELQDDSFKLSSSWNLQNCNQSRFSFARQ